jgi:hypothetical protein
MAPQFPQLRGKASLSYQGAQTVPAKEAEQESPHLLKRLLTFRVAARVAACAGAPAAGATEPQGRAGDWPYRLQGPCRGNAVVTTWPDCDAVADAALTLRSQRHPAWGRPLGRAWPGQPQQSGVSGVPVPAGAHEGKRHGAHAHTGRVVPATPCGSTHNGCSGGEGGGRCGGAYSE